MSDENANLIMWAVGQIAERDDVSPPAVSKAVKKLIEEKPDTPVERDGRGRVSRVSLAHYDHFRQRFVNPAKASAPIRPVSEAGSNVASDQSSSFDEARRQAEWLKVGRERIRHQEALGQLVRKDVLEDAVKTIGNEIRTVLQRIPHRADEVALAVSKEGLHGARVVLRQISFDIGNEVANHLLALADAAPAFNATIPFEGE